MQIKTAQKWLVYVQIGSSAFIIVALAYERMWLPLVLIAAMGLIGGLAPNIEPLYQSYLARKIRREGTSHLTEL